MHASALAAGSLFAHNYLRAGMRVIDLGGRDVNGSLRPAFERMDIEFVCVDMEEHPSVDVVVAPGRRLPFDDCSVDAVVTTSCFEHDPCFWMTIREMARITKPRGYLYANVPSSGPYHGHPGDNWRFYRDAGQALAFWCGQMFDGCRFGLRVSECFHVEFAPWNDFVCIWQRDDTLLEVTRIVDDAARPEGPLQLALRRHGARCGRTSAR